MEIHSVADENQPKLVKSAEEAKRLARGLVANQEYYKDLERLREIWNNWNSGRFNAELEFNTRTEDLVDVMMILARDDDKVSESPGPDGKAYRHCHALVAFRANRRDDILNAYMITVIEDLRAYGRRLSNLRRFIEGEVNHTKRQGDVDYVALADRVSDLLFETIGEMELTVRAVGIEQRPWV